MLQYTHDAGMSDYSEAMLARLIKRYDEEQKTNDDPLTWEYIEPGVRASIITAFHAVADEIQGELY